MWYRYFLGPASGTDRTPSVSATLLAGPLPGALEDYAQTFLAGKTLASSRDEERQGVKGRSYQFASADGATQYALVLLAEQGRVFGVYTQGAAAAFDAQRKALDEISASLTLERAAQYPELSEPDFGFSLRVPPSWHETRRFSGGKTLLLQYSSPNLAVDKGNQTVHASLTVTVEPLPAGIETLDEYYDATRVKLGEAFKIVGHGPWQKGYTDVMTTETQLSAARVKRFYTVAGGRAYSLSFEARADVYPRVARWCDLIASGFRAAGEP